MGESQGERELHLGEKGGDESGNMGKKGGLHSERRQVQRREGQAKRTYLGEVEGSMSG